MTRTAIDIAPILRMGGFRLTDAQTVVTKLTEHDSALDALEAGVVSTTRPYVDLGAQYGVVADSKAAAAANQTAIALALSDYASTACRIKFPKGKVYVDKKSGSGSSNSHSIALDGAIHTAPKVLDLTDTVLCQYGAGNGGQWSLLEFRNGFRGATVLGGVLQCSMITSPDPSSYQHYLMHFVNSAGASYTGDVTVIGTRFGQSKRAAIRILGEAGYPVSHVRFFGIDIDMRKSYDDTTITPTGACFEMQRGFSDITVDGFYFKGAQLSTIDMEPTAGAGSLMDRVTFQNGVADGTGTTATQCVSLGGAGTGQESTRGVFRNVEVISGNVAILSSASWLLDRVTIKLDQADAGSQLFSGVPLVYVYQNAIDLELRDCQLERTSACSAGPLVYALADAGTSGFPTRLKINGGRFVQSTSATIISVESCTGFMITGRPTLRFDGASPTANHAVLIKAVAGNMSRVAIDGFNVESPNGKLATAVYFATASSGGWSISDAIVTGVQAANLVTTGVTFDLSSAAYTAGSRMPAYPVLQGNDFAGATAWVAANSAAGAVFPVIGGNRGGVCTVTGTASNPNTLPVVGAVGSRYVYDNASPTFWLKTGSSTWTQVTVP